MLHDYTNAFAAALVAVMVAAVLLFGWVQAG